jgi:LysR family hydrogen peroxide-inducible transcriptional activator
MELHQLRYFVAVAESRSFSRGAAACAVAQPSLSQQVQKLEAELGQRLFDRLGRTIALTDAARALLPRARRVLAEVEAAGRAVTDEVQDGRGTLAVGAIPTIAPFVLPGAAAEFTRANPAAELVLREDFTVNLVEALAKAELDLCVCSLPLDDERIAHEELATEPLLVAAASGHRFACDIAKNGRRACQRLRPEDLDGEPAVVLHELHCLGQQVKSFCRQRRLSPRIVCRTTQLATVRGLVAKGLGVSLVPQMCAAADRDGGCTYCPVDDPDLHRTIVVAWHAGRGRSRLAERFIVSLRAECQRATQFPPTRQRTNRRR